MNDDNQINDEQPVNDQPAQPSASSQFVNGIKNAQNKMMMNKMNGAKAGKSSRLTDALNKNKHSNGLPGMGKGANPFSSGSGESREKGSSSNGGDNKSGGLPKLPGGLNPLNKLKAGGLGGAKGAAAKAATSKVKKALLIKLLPIIAAALGVLLIIIFAASIVMMPSYLIGEVVEKIEDFGDKFSNVLTGDGFTETTELISNNLTDAQTHYEANDCGTDVCYIDPFDEGILLTTVHHYNVLDGNTYTSDPDETGTSSGKDENGEDTYEGSSAYNDKKSDLSDVEVNTQQTKSYYKAVKGFLGPNDYLSDDLDQEGLTEKLVDFKMYWECSSDKTILDNVENFFQTTSTYGTVLAYALDKAGFTITPADTIELFININRAFSNASSFDKEGFDYLKYIGNKVKYDAGTTPEQLVEFFSTFFDGGTTSCVDGTTAVPYYKRYINYKSYIKYLQDVYIPAIYFECDKCKTLDNGQPRYKDEQKAALTKSIINDIITERNAYYDGLGIKNHLYLKYEPDGSFEVSVSNVSQTYNGTTPIGTEGTGWKQYTGDWSSYLLGNGSSTSMRKVGCYVTSLAIVMANSKTAINGSYFDPGVLAYTIKTHNGFTTGGGLIGANTSNPPWLSLAPNFKAVGDNVSTSGMSISTIQNNIGKALDSGYVVVVHVHGGGHFIAVVGSENGQIIVSDPGTSAKTGKLSSYANVQGGIVDYRVYNPNA